MNINPMDFGSILTGLQQMSKKDKLILVALMDRRELSKNGEKAEVDRYIGEMNSLCDRGKISGQARDVSKDGAELAIHADQETQEIELGITTH